MSKPDFSLCDICGKRAPELGFFVAVGRSYDGVESSDDGRIVDLCQDHLKSAVEFLLGKDHEIGKKFMEMIDRASSRRKS